MNVRLPNTLIARIEARRILLGKSAQYVIRSCLVRRLDGVENAMNTRFTTTREGSVSTPIDVPTGMSAHEVRVRIHLALEDTEDACRPWQDVQQAHKAKRYEVVEAEA